MGLSPGQLAKESGVSRAYLWQLETGGKDRPSLDILERLAKALGVGVSEFTDLEPPRSGDNRLPPGLAELVQTKREELDITDGDIEVLKEIHYRGRRPKDQEDWALLHLFLRRLSKE